MLAWDQKRRFGRVPATSDVPRGTDITRPPWHVSVVPKADIPAVLVYFISVMTGLSLALIRMTIVFDILSVAFLPK